MPAPNAGSTWEKIRKFSDPPLTKCEKCGGKLKQLLSSPAIRFKGTGWYITDYAKRSSTPAGAAADSGNGDKGKSTEAVKTEASSAKSADNKTVAEKIKLTKRTQSLSDLRYLRKAFPRSGR